jgi:oligo-1,6-glucosidase
VAYGKWRPLPIDLAAFKRVLGKWQVALADDGWNSLFWGNHDLPRAVSRYGDTAGYHRESAKMLATVLHLLKGTPFIYQGEEIGMTNVPFTAIGQYRDIETINRHRLHLEAGLSPDEFLAAANASSRDKARTPMQWSGTANAGFTTGQPWIEVNANYPGINVERSLGDDRSILNHYRRLIALRKQHPVIVYGRYQGYLDQDPSLFVYTRTLDAQRIVVVANFGAAPATLELPDELLVTGQCLIFNYEPVETLSNGRHLRPYECFAILTEQGP